MRVVIYARVSTKDQSCDLQLRDLRAYCALPGQPGTCSSH
jgi:DNA invertase Pin-like site-specific DNA recombinase